MANHGGADKTYFERLTLGIIIWAIHEVVQNREEKVGK